MSRLSHEYPDQPEMWSYDFYRDAADQRRKEARESGEPRHVASVLRDIMHEQAQLRGGLLCEFCQLRPATHTLIVDTPDEFTGIPVECCDGCDDAEPSDLELSDR